MAKKTAQETSQQQSNQTRKDPVQTAKKVAEVVTTTGEIVGTVAKTAIGVASAVKTIIGMFNDPKWYTFEGSKPELAFNANRPFDTKSIDSIYDSTFRPVLPDIGVSHVVKMGLGFTLIDEEDTGFSLAMSKMFREMRLSLKSNLTYSERDLKRYILAAIPLFAAVKSVERALGWYTATRQDMPSLAIALQSSPASYYENGIVNSETFNFLDTENIGNTLAEYEKLRQYINLLPFPKKYAEYISWWVGSVFVDSSLANPQLYINELRSCPLYRITNSGLEVTHNFDLVHSHISDLVVVAKELLNTNAVMLADLSKIGSMGKMQIQDVNTYKMVVLQDKEYFNMIINAYTSKRSTSGAQVPGLGTENYVRVDVLPGTPKDYTTGITAALLPYFDVHELFYFVSQAAYFTVSENMQIPCNVTTDVPLSSTSPNEIATTTVATPTEVENGIYVQLSTIVEFGTTFRIKTVASDTVQTLVASANSRLDNRENLIFTAVNARNSTSQSQGYTARIFVPTWESNKSTVISAAPIAYYYDEEIGAMQYLALLVDPSDDALKLVRTPTLEAPMYSFSPLDATITYSVTGEDRNNGTQVLFSFTERDEFRIQSQNNITINILANVLSAESLIMEPELLGSASFSYVPTVDTAQVHRPVMLWPSILSNAVDYAIPLLVRDGIRVYSDTRPGGVLLYTDPYLLKDTYVPFIAYKENVLTTWYSMKLGLFSLSGKAEVIKSSTNKERTKPKK